MTKYERVGNFVCHLFKQREEVSFERMIKMAKLDNGGELVTQQLDEYYRDDMGTTDLMLRFAIKEENGDGRGSFDVVKGTTRLIVQDAYGNYNVIELEEIIKREMGANIGWPDVGGERSPPSEAGSQKPGYGGFFPGDSRAVSASSSRGNSPPILSSPSSSTSPTPSIAPENSSHLPEESAMLLR